MLQGGVGGSYVLVIYSVIEPLGRVSIFFFGFQDFLICQVGVFAMFTGVDCLLLCTNKRYLRLTSVESRPTLSSDVNAVHNVPESCPPPSTLAPVKFSYRLLRLSTPINSEGS